MGTKDAIYDVEKLAAFFQVSQKTIRKWCREGKLPAFKIGLEWKVRISDVQRMIDTKVRSAKERDKTLFE